MLHSSCVTRAKHSCYAVSENIEILVIYALKVYCIVFGILAVYLTKPPNVIHARPMSVTNSIFFVGPHSHVHQLCLPSWPAMHFLMSTTGLVEVVNETQCSSHTCTLSNSDANVKCAGYICALTIDSLVS